MPGASWGKGPWTTDPPKTLVIGRPKRVGRWRAFTRTSKLLVVGRTRPRRAPRGTMQAMRPWHKFERRAAELEFERVRLMSGARRAEEARQLFDELCRRYSDDELKAELQRRREDRIAWLRSRPR